MIIGFIKTSKIIVLKSFLANAGALFLRECWRRWRVVVRMSEWGLALLAILFAMDNKAREIQLTEHGQARV